MKDNTPTLPAPTLSGVAGDAWLQDLVAIRARVGARANKDTTLASWLLRVPWAAPMTPCYWLTLVHLRCVPGVKVPRIYLPGATHELVLCAHNPDFPLDVTACPVPHLVPTYFAAQFVAESDRAAKLRVWGTVQEVLAGQLGPDTDWTQQWVARYGDNMLLPHMRATAGQTKLVLQREDGTRQELVVDGKKASDVCKCIHGRAPHEVCEDCGQMRHDFQSVFHLTRAWRKGALVLPRALLAKHYIEYRQQEARRHD